MFIFSKLLFHVNICSRIIEELVECFPKWCSSIERLLNNVETDVFYFFVLRGPLVLDLILLVLKKWKFHLKDASSDKSVTKSIIKNKTIKNLWKLKWDITNNNLNYDFEIYVKHTTILKDRLIKFSRKIRDDFPLMIPQIYCGVELLGNCERNLNLNKKMPVNFAL